jgi:hypothetical protein
MYPTCSIFMASMQLGSVSFLYNCHMRTTATCSLSIQLPHAALHAGACFSARVLLHAHMHLAPHTPSVLLARRCSAPAAADGLIPGTGHFHVYVDVPAAQQPGEGEAIPFDDAHKHFGKGQTAADLELDSVSHNKPNTKACLSGNVQRSCTIYCVSGSELAAVQCSDSSRPGDSVRGKRGERGFVPCC